jgi:4-hydroxybenzoyl-CoA reductase subunit beta
MLPLPELEWRAPRTLAELVGALAEAPGSTLIVAGGTDLVPNLKHGLIAPERLVSLRRVAELATVEETVDGGMRIGAGVTLDRVGADDRVAARFPALAQAARQVAAPQIRRMATLGGNLLLDTRCRYYNQTAFWRGALGYCLKKDGDVCHVVPQGKRCVAAMSADTPAPLIGYGATVDLVSVRGTRTLPVEQLFSGDGIKNTVREADEVLTQITLPAPRPGVRSAYEKLRTRQAIDFPLLSVAAVVELDERSVMGDVRVVVGALGAKPRSVHLHAFRGQPLSDATADRIAAAAHAQCHPLANLGAESWRQDVVGPVVRRALAALQ